MDVSHSFPPSPAFSDCDSLAGIDDLDAFLDSKGKLSHWPTPPSKREIEEDLEVPSEESDYESEDGVDDLDIATVFARELGLDGAQAWDDVLLIEELLVRVRLPIEVLAIAFNILSKLVKQPNVDTLLQDLALDALILSTLSLASIYTNDRPLSASHLARNVAPGPVTAMDIDMANISVMSALDWRIHDCTEGAAIVAALRMFERREPPNYVPNLVQEPYHEPYLKPEPLCLRLTDRHSSGATHWDNGQLTPAASSSCSVAAEFEHSFLPLL